jgi:hypothetical protein
MSRLVIAAIYARKSTEPEMVIEGQFTDASRAAEERGRRH